MGKYMNKRIGIIIPEIFDALEYDLIKGMYAKAKEKNCDLLVLTGVFNSHQEFQQDSYTNCLENIYELIEYGRFDGFVFSAGRFNNLLVRDKIYSMLRKREIPCVVLDDENEFFLSIYPDQRESIKMITKHLINEHGCKKIYCITGIEGNRDSIERLEGFRDALLETGVECGENCIFYGGFWKDIPADIARKIASGELEMPDAVVCASDIMAIA